METYRRDEAMTLEAGRPVAVVFPTTKAEIQSIMRIAHQHRVAVVPRGAGTGLSGGATAIDGCVVLSLERMNRLLDLDRVNLYAVVEPGLINSDLNRAANELGLSYSPDPASRDMSTLGGNVATNAGGLCCLKYGVTRESVLGLTVVLADGEIVRLGRKTLKGVAGYDLTALFVGSEGTLGVVAEATLRLRPKPPAPATLLAFFPALVSAGAATVAIRNHLVPAMLELLDRFVIAAVETWKPQGLDTAAAAMLIAQSDAGGDQSAAEVAAMQTYCVEQGASFTAVTSDPLESGVFLQARKLALPSLKRRGTTMVDDVSVPCSQLPNLLTEIEAVANVNHVEIATYGHAGDGNMHPTIIFDAADEDSQRRAVAAFDGVVRAALRLGGTVAGEHGIGLLKREYLREELGEESFALHKRIKKLFDPHDILNPGKLF
jgi:glycolate oxidase